MPQQYNSHRSIEHLDGTIAGVNGLLFFDIIDMRGTGYAAKGASDLADLGIGTWQT
jgi:hypothetical protein